VTSEAEVAAAFLRVAATRYTVPDAEQVADWTAALLRAGCDPEVADRLAGEALDAAEELAGPAAQVAGLAEQVLKKIHTITERTQDGHGIRTENSQGHDEHAGGNDGGG
jgi:hypothetical protein